MNLVLDFQDNFDKGDFQVEVLILGNTIMTNQFLVEKIARLFVMLD